jgi:hypothetical protein
MVLVRGVICVFFVEAGALGGLLGLLGDGLGLPSALLGLKLVEVSRSVVGVAKIDPAQVGGIRRCARLR